jgi:hypothetical protein
MEVNIWFGRGAFVFGIPRVHPFVYGVLRHEGALVCAGNRFADHQAFRLCAPLQTLNGLFGQPRSGTVLLTGLLLKPGFDFEVETQGESARAATTSQTPTLLNARRRRSSLRVEQIPRKESCMTQPRSTLVSLDATPWREMPEAATLLHRRIEIPRAISTNTRTDGVR